MDKQKNRGNKIPSPRKQPLSPAAYLAISTLCLIIGISLMLFFVFKANDLIAAGISKMVFYVLLIPLGFSASGFLFGVMRSYAVFSGNALGGKFELGGPVALFALIIIGGFKLVPDNSPFDVTFFIHGNKGKQDIVLSNTGKVLLDISGDRREAQIIENGSATFKNISAEFWNQIVPVSIQAEGFELDKKKGLCTLSTNSIYLGAKRDNSLANIAGTVIDENGTPMDSVRVCVLGIETYSKNGFFSLTIPPEKQQEEQSVALYKKGYKTRNITVYPKSKTKLKTILKRE